VESIPSYEIDPARAVEQAGARLTGPLTLHHVGIVCPDTSLLESFLSLAGVDEDTTTADVAFRHVPEFQCDCYLVGKIELVVPNGPHKEGTPLHRWLLSRGRSLHHVAFEVPDIESQCERLRAAGVPIVLDAAVQGVAGLRVNFVQPSYCGFLVELVQVT
jgi:catechol 2,3-dioxygenase-like lactoylglutathione lyase family enzyme